MQPLRWSLLIHNIPPKPAYLRNKVANRLAGLGAIALKNSVYVLPNSAAAREGFMWLAQEVESGGGKAFVGEAEFQDPTTEAWIREAFMAARNRDYEPLLAEAESISTRLEHIEIADEPFIKSILREMDAIRKRVEEIHPLDFFQASHGKTLAARLAALEAKLGRMDQSMSDEKSDGPLDTGTYCNKTWVTRRGIFVDRMASGWLIRRFIDPGAKFKFVELWEYSPESDEILFDVPQGAFTHEGERCTFEVLVRRFALSSLAMKKLAEIIHDIDVQAGDYAHKESSGVAAVLSAIAMSTDDDHERLHKGGGLLDDLFNWLSR